AGAGRRCRPAPEVPVSKAMRLLPVVAVPPAVAAVATAAATAPAGAGRLGTRLVDHHPPAHHHGVVEGVDGGLPVGGLGHRHEAEAAVAAGLAVPDDGGVHHLAEAAERLPELLLLHVIGQVASVELHLMLSYHP